MPLEAIRGLAAVSVVLWHCTLGFLPHYSGLFPVDRVGQAAFPYRFWFGLINGPAAVVLFFVLSGFVLTRRFLLKSDGAIILRIALKRWPRLAGPVVASTLLSWFLFRIGAYRFEQVGLMTDSAWLKTFGMAFHYPFVPRFGGALGQGVYTTFFQGASFYDSSLWTMRYEFAGSFIALGLAAVLSTTRRGQVLPRAIIILIVYLLCTESDEFYTAFPIGVALAAFLPEWRHQASGILVGLMIALALYLYGYTGVPIGAFALADGLLRHFPVVSLRVFASALLIIAIEIAPLALRDMLSGRVSKVLGMLSFPLYLVHVPVLCSVGCLMYLAARGLPDPFPIGLAALSTLAGAIIVAIPLAAFNDWWVTVVTRFSEILTRGQAVEADETV